MKMFTIKINEEIINVSEEIYVAYYKMGRRERYLEEVSKKNNVSYNRLAEKGYPIEAKLVDSLINVEDEIIKKIMFKKLIIAFDSLSSYERVIIKELFINGQSIRELSNSLDIPKSTINKHKNKILKKMKKIIEKI